MRLIFFMMLIAAACSAQPVGKDAHRLSLIITADSVLAYNGQFSENGKVRRIAAAEKAVENLLRDEQKKYGNQLVVILKPGNNGMADNAPKASNNLRMTVNVLNELEIHTRDAVPMDSLELAAFQLVNFPLPGTSEPMQLFLPEDEDAAMAQHVDPKHIFTLLLTQRKVLHYRGVLISKAQAKEVNYTEIRKIIADAKKSIGDSLYLHIKPAEDAGYQNIVNTLDEMSIGNISRYVMLNLSPNEQRLLGLRGYMTIDEGPVTITTPSSVTVKTSIAPNTLVFTLDENGSISYSIEGNTSFGSKKINPATTKNIGQAIDEVARLLNKKPADLMVCIKGDEDARYPNFKTLIDALKEKEMFKFSLITDK